MTHVENNLIFNRVLEESDRKQLEKHQIQLRLLQIDDYDRGYLNLLGQLTQVGEIDRCHFHETFKMIHACCDSYYILVAHHLPSDRIIGNTTLFLEHKFIHSCGTRARIEDVVVDVTYRKYGISSLMIRNAMKIAEEKKCYKISLECKDELVDFYARFGFIRESNQNFMCKRYI